MSGQSIGEARQGNKTRIIYVQWGCDPPWPHWTGLQQVTNEDHASTAQAFERKE